MEFFLIFKLAGLTVEYYSHEKKKKNYTYKRDLSDEINKQYI